MNGERFDAFAKLLGKPLNRRTAVGSLSAVAVSIAVRDGLSAQLAPATCAGDGAACIMLTGCCDGFTCVTSAINPNLGVCQSGGTGGVEIQSPAASGSTTAQTATPTTNTSTSRHTHTPGDNKKTKDSYDITVALNCGVDTETITVKNKGLYAVTLTKFASSAIPTTSHEDPFPNNITINPGKHLTFYNGVSSPDLPKNAMPWYSSGGIFNNAGDRLSVYYSQSSTPVSASCGSTVSSTTVGGTGGKKKHKRRKKR